MTGYKWDSLLEDLSNYDYTAAFKSARSKRHNGTAEWVFSTAEFESWYGKDASAVHHLVGKSKLTTRDGFDNIHRRII